jgi:hypothetical protein
MPAAAGQAVTGRLRDAVCFVLHNYLRLSFLMPLPGGLVHDQETFWATSTVN